MLLTLFGRNVHRRRNNNATTASNNNNNEHTFRAYEERQIEINELNQFVQSHYTVTPEGQFVYNCECRHPANCSVYQQHPDIDLIIFQTFDQERYMRFKTITAAARRSRALREHRERTGHNYDSHKKADSMLYLLKMFLTFGWVLVVSVYSSFVVVVVASLTYTISIYWTNRPETKLWLASLHDDRQQLRPVNIG